MLVTDVLILMLSRPSLGNCVPSAGVGHVWDSLHVAAYIDEVFPAASTEGKLRAGEQSHAGAVDLLPRGDSAAAVLQRAHLRIWADHCAERIWKSFYTLLFSQVRVMVQRWRAFSVR